MVTATHSVYPVLHVIAHGGSVSFKTLAKELMDFDPRRFESEYVVHRAIEQYSACLDFVGDQVVFDKKAGHYSKLYERYVQAALHRVHAEKMKDLQLYPFRDTRNSETCYIGLPWNEIPKDSFPKGTFYPDWCDYKANGRDECHLRCNVEESVVEDYRHPKPIEPFKVTDKTTVEDFIKAFESNRGVRVHIDDTKELLITGMIDKEYDFAMHKNYKLQHSMQFANESMTPKEYIGQFSTIKSINYSR